MKTLMLAIVALMLFQPSGYSQAVVRTADPVKRGLKDTDFPRIQKLADGVYSYEQLRASGQEKFTTVSMFVVTTDGVLVADGQGNQAETKRMIDEIAKITTQPIKWVVICSDHGDHTAGNDQFPSTATFIAHPTSKTNLETRANAPNRQPNAPKIIIPTRLVANRETLKVGGTDVQIIFNGRGHTAGDLIVYLPKDKILFMGEVYLNRIFPAMNPSGYPSEWIASVKKAEAMDVKMYIPGHGFVENGPILKEELIEFRKAMEHVVAEGKRLHAAKIPVEEAIKQANFGPYTTWSLYGNQWPGAIRKVYDELDGKLK